MPDIRMGSVPNRVLPIVYVIDTSNSMSGERIYGVNEGICKSVYLLRDWQTSVSDLKIGIAALSFNTRSEWMFDGLIGVEACGIEDLKVGGTTSYGQMLKALNKGMNNTDLFRDNMRYFVPTIIFITDGTSIDEWEKPLDEIEQNKWFGDSIKLAVGIGDDIDAECLKSIVGPEGAVVRIDKVNSLSDFLSNLSLSIGETFCKEIIDRVYIEEDYKNTTTAEKILQRTMLRLGYSLNDILRFEDNLDYISLVYPSTFTVVDGGNYGISSVEKTKDSDRHETKVLDEDIWT